MTGLSKAAPGPRPKAFHYTTSVTWLDGRAGELAGGDGKPRVRVASPPEFRGEPNTWTPEDLFVAAIDTCLLLTFVGFAEKEDLRFDSYVGRADGLLEWIEGGFQFTNVTLTPQIIVRDAAAAETARRVVAHAHRNCLVARSVRCNVAVEPEIRIRS